MLERLLNGGATGGPFEVLDLGVGGYSTRDEALTLESKGMRWNPKLIVIGYVLNDPESEPIQPMQSYFQEPSWWQHSALLRMLARCKNVLCWTTRSCSLFRNRASESQRCRMRLAPAGAPPFTSGARGKVGPGFVGVPGTRTVAVASALLPAASVARYFTM